LEHLGEIQRFPVAANRWGKIERDSIAFNVGIRRLVRRKEAKGAAGDFNVEDYHNANEITRADGSTAPASDDFIVTAAIVKDGWLLATTIADAQKDPSVIVPGRTVRWLLTGTDFRTARFSKRFTLGLAIAKLNYIQ
jgi:hypothetical protein